MSTPAQKPPTQRMVVAGINDGRMMGEGSSPDTAGELTTAQRDINRACVRLTGITGSVRRAKGSGTVTINSDVTLAQLQAICTLMELTGLEISHGQL
ncbi:MAG: hypothetical protein K2Y25_09260 [Pseudomonadaceae bacterium]|nr:hypothetical protein [Pseudomonadaceae bacterium]